MKKKLKMISKLFASITLLGCFGFGLFALLDHSQKQNYEVRAEDEREPYNYDYRYTLQYYEYGCVNDDFNVVSNQSYGYTVQFKYTYRMILHFNDESGYVLSFDNMNFKNLYFKTQYNSGNNILYTVYLNYNESLGYALNDLNFNYSDDLSYLRNANNYYDIYVDCKYYYSTGVLNIGLLFYKKGQNYVDSPRYTVDVIENFDDYLTVEGTYSSDFSFNAPLIKGFNPYVIGNGIDTAIRTAYDDGISGGAEAEWYEGYTLGRQSGYDEGYVAGFNEGSSQDSTAFTIFNGILNVALVPINFFLAIFNFEILGINLSGFIRALFTLAITIIVIRTIFGGKGASDS